jgi:hypothetical protein
MYDRDFKAVSIGVKIQKKQEKNKKAKDYAYRRSLRFQLAKQEPHEPFLFLF